MATSHEPPPALAEFERLVDAHVTPHMARLGYVRIGASEHGTESRAPLVSGGGRRRRRLGVRRTRRKKAVRQAATLAMGYEARDETAAARLYPGNPQNGDEVWLYVDAGSGAFDLDVGLRLRDLVERHGSADDGLVILSPEQPLAARLERLDQVLHRYVRSLLSP